MVEEQIIYINNIQHATVKLGLESYIRNRNIRLYLIVSINALYIMVINNFYRNIYNKNKTRYYMNRNIKVTPKSDILQSYRVLTICIGEVH